MSPMDMMGGMRGMDDMMGGMSDGMNNPAESVPRNSAAGPENMQKSTRPNTKEFGKKWMDRITRAVAAHDSFTREGRLYYGLYYHQPNAWKKAVTIKGYSKPLVLFSNPVARNIDMDRDRMLPKMPTFKASPRVRWLYFTTPDGQIAKRDNVQAARMYQEVANVLAQELDLRKFMRRSITDSLVTNLGVIKCGWDEVGALSHGSAHIEDKDGKLLGGTKVGDGPNTEIAQPNFPWVTNIPWDRIILDPTAGCIEQVNWVAEWIIEPEKASDAPKQRDEGDQVSSLQNVAVGSQEETEYPLRDKEAEVTDIKLRKHLEIHYREADSAEEGGFSYWTFDLYPNQGGVVKNHRKYDKNIGGFVYEFVQFREVVGDLMGYSQIRYYASPAAHDNLAKQIILDYAIRTLPFLIVNSGVGKTALGSMMDSGAGKVVTVNQGIPKEVAHPVQLPPINQELLAVAQMVRAASDEMSGRSLNDRLQGGVQTATEAKVIDRNSGEALQSQIDVLRIFASRVIKKCVRIYKELLDENQRYIIPNGRGGFLQFEKQDLECDVAVELDWQSTVRKDDAVERKLNMDLLTILVNSMPMLPNINIEPVLKKIVVSSGFDDPAEIFTPPEQEPTDPAQEHMLMLAGVPVMPSPDEDLAKNYQEHVEFAAVVTSDPQLKQLWDMHPGALQMLVDHIAATRMMAEKSGQAMEAGLLPGAGGGSGPGNNRASQGIPSEGDMMGQMSRATNVGGGGSGRLADV